MQDKNHSRFGTHSFSRAWRGLLEIGSNSDWLILSCASAELDPFESFALVLDTQMQVDKIIYLHILVFRLEKKGR